MSDWRSTNSNAGSEPGAAHEPFAVWLTGLPASGKSTIAAALHAALRRRGVAVVTLESDALRPILTPDPDYTPVERDRFYDRLVQLGDILINQRLAVIFDATANRAAYRDAARRRIARFLEVHVDTPRSTCEQRDPKGIYAAARAGRIRHVPGIDAPYEPPADPDLTIRADREDPAAAADRVADRLRRSQLVPGL